MLYDPQNFLHSLLTYAVTAGAARLDPSLALAYAPYGNGGAKPWNLFLNQASEDFAADPYAVVRIFGGTHERTNPKVIANVQCEVIGTANVAAWNLANGLYRLLALDNQENELRMLQVAGYKLADNTGDGNWMLVDALIIAAPGQVGRDDRGRVRIVSNFSLGFYKLPNN